MAKHLSRLANQVYEPRDGGEMRPPDPIHVWVIGRDSWWENVAEPIRSIREGESDPAYRIVVVGEGLSSIRHHLPDWSNWIYLAGMRKKKRHADLARFRAAAGTLLGVMHDHYDETSQPPTSVLEALDVPVAFVGGSGQQQ